MSSRQRLRLEAGFERRLHGFGDLVNRQRAGCFLAQACHGDVLDATGNDGLETAQGHGLHIECETVHGDPFANADADGGKLSICHPHAREAFAAAGGDLKMLASEDQRLFDAAEVIVEVSPVLSEVEHEIADELSGAMVGGLSAAVGLDHWQAGCLGLKKAGTIGSAPDRDHGLVLEQQNRIFNLTGQSFFDELFLDLVGFLPGDAAQPSKVHGGQMRRRSAWSTRLESAA